MLTRPAFQASVLLLLVSNIAASAPLVTRDTFTCVDDAECEARYVSDSWLIEKVVLRHLIVAPRFPRLGDH